MTGEPSFQQRHSRVHRRTLGQHFTHETDILKVIHPLFLTGWTERAHAALTTNNTDAATALNREITQAVFLDPAAGNGNFLTTTYQHLTTLNNQLRPLTGPTWKPVTLTQFHGIEIDPEAAHDGNTHLTALATTPNATPIHVGNALHINWSTIAPIGPHTYIFGNPPFLGRRSKTPDQRTDQTRLWGKTPGSGNLDYATNWLLIAAQWINTTRTQAAFVITNSISQGEQPGILWTQLTPLNVTIPFAHRTFPWWNGDGEQAAVHCVIIALSHTDHTPPTRLLWDENNTLHEVPNINGFLAPAPNVHIPDRDTPLAPNLPTMRYGVIPADGAHLTRITPDEAAHIRATDPIAAKYLRPLAGAHELLNGRERYCLWLKHAPTNDLTNSPTITEKLTLVAASRRASKNATARAFAATPHLFHPDRQPEHRYLAVPIVSSDNRVYLPTGFLPPEVIATSTLTIENADMFTFGLLSSRAFITWARAVSGRMKSDLRMSVSITYNNFPAPNTTPKQAAAITHAAQTVLDARNAQPHATLADLYANDTHHTYPALTAAHTTLDAAVLDAYGLPPDADDTELLTALFNRYTALTGPTTAPGQPDTLF